MSLYENIDESWEKFFTEDIKKELDDIEEKIGDKFYPSKENVLRFAKTDFNNIKCVIVGMDPYPSDFIKNGILTPEATGRSFEVASLLDKTWSAKFKQSSLRNMLKTVYFNETGNIESLEDIRCYIENNTFDIKQPRDWFNSLENQGVLFLNATLTVVPGKPDSHTKIWDGFMNELIKFIDKKNVTWLLFGDKAQKRVLPFVDENHTICTVHPRIASFVEENPFGKVKNINWKG